jgi:trk system potassium uptake protein
MKIIIAGLGKSGIAIAQMLSHEGHDITVVDINGDIINQVSNGLDVICICGNATNPGTLMRAGAEEADMLVAATRSDEVNMICGIAAHSLGTQHVIARIRDPEYMTQTNFLRETLGLSMIVNPELECAREISRILRFPSAARVDVFSRGSAEIVEHRVLPGEKLDGVRLSGLHDIVNAAVLVSVVERGEDAFIPNGDFVLRGGDKLSITGSSKELRRFFTAVGKYKKPVKKVLIMGGGRIAVYLTGLLEEAGMSVTVIERDKARCDELCDLIPHATIIIGDATNSDVLQEEGIRTADAFVALSGEDGDNIVTSMYARQCCVGTIVTKVNRGHFTDVMESYGLDCVVSPKDLVAQQLARYARATSNSAGSSMETLYKLADGRIEALEFIAGEDSACVGKSLREMKLKRGVLVCAVIRGSRSIIPDGSTQILAGDHAVVVAGAGKLKTLDDILEGKR